VATGVKSGLVVLDVDPRHGGDESLIQLTEALGGLPDTLVALTGGGGRHLFFGYPADHDIRNAAALGGYEGLDLRGEGGYIVAPPSLHESGRNYSWQDPDLSGGVPVSPMPQNLVQFSLKRKQPAKDHRDSPGKIVEGTRNNELASLGGAMRRKGFDQEAIEAALQEHNRRHCIPPLPVAEVKGIARSIASYEPQAASLDPVAQWPAPMTAEAFYGLPGEIVETILPHTEADPVALLAQLLCAVGSAIGRGPYSMAESDKHGANLNVALVGETSKGRKGSSWGHIRRLMELAAPDWMPGRVQAGLSSGEGLIWHVRDPIEKLAPIKEKGRVEDYQTVLEDPGIDDKRLLIMESELASVLKVFGRDGNTLSAVIRQAWDKGDLSTLTKNSPAKASGAHISIIGHITRQELNRYLDRTEMANGFANRFLWLCVRRSKCLPDGGNLSDQDFQQMAKKLEPVLCIAATEAGVMRRDEEARKLWHQVYSELSEGSMGLFGAVTSRAEAQVTRLSVLYALFDLSPVIRVEHLQAALAFWAYAENSCRYIFGSATGDPLADELWAALCQAEHGLTRTEIRDRCGRHKNRHQVNRALSELESRGRVERATETTGGRPLERWRPIAAATIATKATEASLWSHRSLMSHPHAEIHNVMPAPTRPDRHDNGGAS
jgi:hypothetical protein